MTEMAGYLGNHLKSHFQCWSNQLWLRPSVTDRPFSEARKFSKSTYTLLARFNSLFSFCLLIVSGYYAFCQWLMHGQFLAQRPILPRRKQAPSGVSLVLNSLLGIYRCCQEQSCLSYFNRTLSY